VLECAVILTTCNALDEVARKNWVIGTSIQVIRQRVLTNPFHTQHSINNGLIQACHQSSVTYAQWQSELMAFLRRHCQSGCRLAGFSVHKDLEVLRSEAPAVHQFLSHQVIDISSLDIIQWGLPALERAARFYTRSHGNHRAMSDNEAAIDKLKWYQQWLRTHCIA